jgi:hypothetical protein
LIDYFTSLPQTLKLVKRSDPAFAGSFTLFEVNIYATAEHDFAVGTGVNANMFSGCLRYGSNNAM